MKTYTCMLMYTDTRSQTRTPTQAQEQAGTQTYLHKRSHTNTYTQCIHTMHTYHQRRSHYSLIVCAYECILHVVLPPPSGCFTVSVCLPVCSFLFSFVFLFHFCFVLLLLQFLCRSALSTPKRLLIGTPRLISNTIARNHVHTTYTCKHTRRTYKHAHTQTKTTYMRKHTHTTMRAS